MRSFLLVLLWCSLLPSSLLSQTLTEAEPNNTFATANPTLQDTTMTGTVGNTPDQFDYFWTVPEDDGTLIIEAIVTGTVTGNDFYLQAYNRNTAGIGSANAINVIQGITDTVTLTLHCVAKDTVYLRLQGNGAFSYAISYTVIPSGQKDAEPNDVFASSQLINHGDTVQGRIGYANVALDVFDYFYTVVPDDGTITLSADFISTSDNNDGDFYLQVFNKGQSSIADNSAINVPPGPGQVSVTEHCVAADTVFFRVQSAGCFSYALSYTISPSGQKDMEPNNVFAEAQHFNHGDTVQGRIGYANVALDVFDYFYTVVPDDGTLTLSADFISTSDNNDGDFYLHVFNKVGGSIANNNVINVPPGPGQVSVTEHCVAADTVYFRVQSAGCFSYALSYTITPSGQSDQEPNNTRATAQSINLRQAVSGRVGYANQTTDVDDYFTFRLDTFSTIAMPLHIVNSSGTTSSDFYLRVLNQQGGSVFLQNLVNMSLSGVQDTFTITCLPPGDYFVWMRGSGCFSYEFQLEPIPQQPSATITVANTGSIFGFEAIVNAQTDAISWDLGDGSSSTSKYVKNNYNIGNYDVILTGTNQTCNLTDRDTVSLTVKGVEYFTPERAGEGGDIVMQVFGGGLDTFTQIELTGPGGSILQPSQLWANEDGTEMQAFFDLHFADAGLYDVDITIPGEPTASFPDGFEVSDFEYPYTLSYITGPDRWRTNRKTRFILNVTNKGNVNASGVVAWMVWPKSVDVEFDTEWFRPPDSGRYEIDFEDSIIVFDYADIQSFYDSSFMVPTAIDSFAGEPYDGYAFSIMIAAIPPGSIYEIPFYAQANNPSQITFETYTIKPNLFGSCGSTSQYDMWQNGAVEAIDVLDQGLGLAKMDKTPLGWLTKGVKATTTHMANLGQALGAASLVADGTYDNIYQAIPAGYDAQVSAGNWQIAKAGLDLAVDKAVDVGADNLLRGHQDNVNKWVLNNPNAKLNSALLASDQLQTINDLRQFVKDAYSQGKNAKWVAEKLDRLAKAAVDCPELQKQIEELKKNVDKDLHQREKRKKRTRSVNSMDPNAISGPPGVDSLGYIQPDYRHSFIAMFENIDTASADAQIVTLSIPIDTMAYDMSTFAFGDITIGGHVFDIPENRQTFITDVSVPYRPGITIRVMGYLENGTAYWRFTSLDSLTQELPILDGFLPPNTIAPQGEGSVEFALTLRDDVANGRTIATQASIIFDENEPILTNTWLNTIDITPGNSSVSASLDNNLIKLNLSGFDSLSGIGYYNIYFSENGGAWIAMGGTSEDTFTIEGLPGVTYGIYVESVDRVGNEESKPAVAEATVTISGIDEKAPNPLRVYPNPNNGQFLITSAIPLPNGQLQMLNFQGQVVLSQPIQLPENGTTAVSVGNLSPGPYVLEVMNEDGRAYRQIIMIQ